MKSRQIILREKQIGHVSGEIPDAKVGFTTGDLALTNEELRFEWKEGLLKKTEHEIVIPLSSIQTHGGLARIKVAKPISFGGPLPLTVFTQDNEEVFLFPSDKKKEIGQWFEAINEAVTGEKVQFNPQDLGALQIGKKLKNVVSSAKPVTSDLADAASPFLDAAAPIVSAVASVASDRHPYASTAISAGLEAMTTKDSADTNTAVPQIASPSSDQGSMTLEDQIEAVKKLKELLDAGILSQEEFDAKKKHIMGL